MRIDWDMPIEMDDGLVLRRRHSTGRSRWAAIRSSTTGSAPNRLHFDDLYSDSWKRMCENAADVPTGSLNKYQCWEVARPGKVGTGQLRGHRRLDSRGAGRSPGAYRQVLTDRGAGSRNASKWPGV